MADYYLNSGASVGLWTTGTAYTAGQRVLATAAASVARKQRVYEVTTPGTSSGTEPAWNTTVGGTTTDAGGVVYTTRNCTSWANANGRYSYICGAVLGANDRIFVKNTHSESLAQPTLNGIPNTVDNPILLLCVSDTNEPPTTLATGALIASTGALALGNAIIHAYGVEFRSGNGAAVTSNLTVSAAASSFDSCTFNLAATAGASVFFPVTGANANLYIRCTITYGAAGASVQMGSSSGGWVVFRNLTLSGTAPTAAFIIQNQAVGQSLLFDGLDASIVTATLISQSTAALKHVKLRNVLVGSGCTVFGGTRENNWLDEFHELAAIVDSGGANYKIVQATNVGDLTTETTFVRSGGASDGTTPVSWKVVTGTNAKKTLGLAHATPWIAQWNEATGSPLTVAVEILRDNATVLKDNEAWIEVEYLGTSGSPITSFATDASDVLAAGADQAVSSATWYTTGMSNAHAQTLSVSVTPQEKGLIRARVAVGKPSTTVYIDPMLTVSA